MILRFEALSATGIFELLIIGLEAVSETEGFDEPDFDDGNEFVPESHPKTIAKLSTRNSRPCLNNTIIPQFSVCGNSQVRYRSLLRGG